MSTEKELNIETRQSDKYRVILTSGFVLVTRQDEFRFIIHSDEPYFKDMSTVGLTKPPTIIRTIEVGLFLTPSLAKKLLKRLQRDVETYEQKYGKIGEDFEVTM